MSASQTIIIPISGLSPETTVLGTDLCASTDVTDLTQAPTGTTKKYTQSQLLRFVFNQLGLTTYQEVQASSTVNLGATYNNGSSGVNATLTNSGTQAVFSLDGQTGVLNSRYLIKNQSTAAQNGIYTLTNIGSATTNWVLTRSVDFNSSSNITNNAIVFVDYGSTNNNTTWQVTFTGPVTVGTTALNWAKYIV